MSLKNQTISGLFWTFVQMFSSQGINFLVLMFMMRILSPKEFGIIALVQIFLGIGQSLVDSGMTSSLLRTQNIGQKDYSTVFFFNIAASFLIYAIIFIGAPFFADYYGQPELINIIRVLSISIIIQSLFAVQNTILTKEMLFRRIMIIQLPALILSGIAGIIMAYYGWGVWSLVYMNILRVCFYSLFYWIGNSWRPKLLFDKVKLKQHLGFGYKLTVSSLINTVFNNINKLVIGKYFSIVQLGLYDKANELKMLPIQNLSMALNKVTFPMFSRIQDNQLKLKEVYRKTMITVLFFTTLLMIIFINTAYPLIRVLYTDKWIEAAPYLEIMCISGILIPLHSYNLNILKVKGRSDLFLKLEIIKKILVVIGIICAIPWGIYGLLYIQLINSILGYVINSFYSGKMIDYSISDQLKDVVPIIIIGAISSFSVRYLLKLSIFESILHNDIINILAHSISITIIFIGLSLLFKLKVINDILSLISKKNKI